MALRDDLHSLKGRRALVCGASKGIGRAAAIALAARGASVTVLARSDELLRELQDVLMAAGASSVSYVVADHDERDRLEEVVSASLAEDGPVHVLVNNSGGPPPGPIVEATAADFLGAFGRHVVASHLLVRLVLPGMRAGGYGRIINVISSSVREPIPNLGVSNTIRGAVASWAKSVANELEPGITINNVLPGFVDTERLASLAETIGSGSGQAPQEVRQGWVDSVPEGRIGRPEELGEVIAFLASPAAAYVRGLSMHVDGGRMHCI